LKNKKKDCNWVNTCLTEGEEPLYYARPWLVRQHIQHRLSTGAGDYAGETLLHSQHSILKFMYLM